ncbi:ras and Rab interactor 2 [Denticeps clupeoides]|uniref:ras and Rab interactor 2 n=1 Tax=Denticeps clupeoides TaxID=299321 RepID=UPI0010A2AB63|nr:ras and Rab interactor 2-like [Denticeps clupeoides]XP_028840895.1 ras and Rab interactor 2-like [Denticeps clupeoides]
MDADVGYVPKSLSVLDRLLLTHPIWLQLSVHTDAALNILQREPVGTFMVCKSGATQGKVLCVRVSEEKSPSAVKEYCIREEDSTFSLESSALSFPDLCRLVAFYCVSRDVLPFPLELPETIAQASSHTQLEAISHLGSEFWSSQSESPSPNGPPPGSACPNGTARLSPCFINPLFLQRPQPQASRAASQRRHRFKRSLRVRVSTESSFSLSPGGSLAEADAAQANHGLQRRGGAGAGPLRRTAALAPTSEEEDDMLTPTQGGDAAQKEEEPCGAEQACLSLEKRRAPSLAELDSSSSFSSLEEEGPESGKPAPAAIPAPATSRPSLRRMSAAFVCFFAPERRVARLVDELSRDRRSAFGVLVQDFLRQRREELTTLQGAPAGSAKASDLLQGLRRFLTQAKNFLLGSGELEPPIETLVPENEKDLALEKAMFGCVLKPLKTQLDQVLLALHAQDGSTQRVADGLRALQRGAAERLGVRAGVLDADGVERARQKLALMRRTHSPVDKVLLLLQVCKSVYKAMGAPPEQEVMSQDFLPALSYVLVCCNSPLLLQEVEYMMELLEPSWLTGEGGYYLTSVFASLCLIQSQPGAAPPSGLTSEARDSLREWSRRRGQETNTHAPVETQRFVRVLYQEGERSAVRTLQWRDGDPAEALARSCAEAFRVAQPQFFSLFCRAAGGEMRPLPGHALPGEADAHAHGVLPSLSYLRSDHDFSKVRRLTRGGAVDLGESVCEE